MLDVAIIGGGAAGFFAAINIKEKNPDWKVAIFEKSPNCLGKVKVSGGGRCNVTHHCFDPKELVAFYPRGNRELLSVFNRFGPKDTFAWFQSRGVNLKTESDGRVFPVTDDSQTIINCFYDACRKLDIKINKRQAILHLEQSGTGFVLHSENGNIDTKKVVVSTGSSEFFWNMLEKLGHTIIRPVPSLFTFNIKDKLTKDLMGLSIQDVEVRILAEKSLIKSVHSNPRDLVQSGPLLVTHWGLSGPAILKLSAVGALLLNRLNYRFKIQLNFCGLSSDAVMEALQKSKLEHARKNPVNTPMFSLPSRFWQRVVELSLENTDKTWADMNKSELQRLTDIICSYEMEVNGKSTNKDEFVTAGGVDLKEVDFKTMESKLLPGLYLAGEVLNIDALTGGFNFQAAWSEAWVISEAHHQAL